MVEIGQDCNKHCDRVIHDLKDYLTVICEYLPTEKIPLFKQITS